MEMNIMHVQKKHVLKAGEVHKALIFTTKNGLK